MEALGRHVLVEYLNCNPDTLNDVPKIESAMVDGAKISGATIINSHFHHFSPYGTSGVVIIQESHLAIHTWPEYRYAAVDLFTCGDTVDPWLAFDHLKEVLDAQNYSVLEMQRGPLNLLKRIPYNAEDFRQIVEEKLGEFPAKRSMWFTDKDDNIALSLRVNGELLFDETSEYQRTRVFDTFGFGKTLTIDNMVMCTERDEAHYHEMISHPAMFAHKNVKNILVIGGGDGGTVREFFKHDSVEKITMVEIDENVVNASKEFLPTLSAGFNDDRLDLKIEDGIEYVKQCGDEQFDLVVIDGSDPVGPAKGLFSAEFYTHCKRILKSDGILITQGESPDFNGHVFKELNFCLKDIFGVDNVSVLLFNIVTYPTGVWSFQIASKNGKNMCDIDANIVQKFVDKNDLTYYTADVHKAVFVLPNYVNKMIKQADY